MNDFVLAFGPSDLRLVLKLAVREILEPNPNPVLLAQDPSLPRTGSDTSTSESITDTDTATQSPGSIPRNPMKTGSISHLQTGSTQHPRMHTSPSAIISNSSALPELSDTVSSEVVSLPMGLRSPRTAVASARSVLMSAMQRLRMWTSSSVSRVSRVSRTQRGSYSPFDRDAAVGVNERSNANITVLNVLDQY